MPASVNNYINNNRDITLYNKDVLEFIRLSYMADMSKYVINAPESNKITAVYESIPRQLAKDNPKFKYKIIKDTAIKRDYYSPIDWLNSSGMIYKINSLDAIADPLKAYENNNIFKIYLSDVGI